MSPYNLIDKVKAELPSMQVSVLAALTMPKHLRVTDYFNGFTTNGFDIWNSDDLSSAIEFVEKLIEINKN